MWRADDGPGARAADEGRPPRGVELSLSPGRSFPPSSTKLSRGTPTTRSTSSLHWPSFRRHGERNRSESSLRRSRSSTLSAKSTAGCWRRHPGLRSGSLRSLGAEGARRRRGTLLWRMYEGRSIHSTVRRLQPSSIRTLKGSPVSRALATSLGTRPWRGSRL